MLNPANDVWSTTTLGQGSELQVNVICVACALDGDSSNPSPRAIPSKYLTYPIAISSFTVNLTILHPEPNGPD